MVEILGYAMIGVLGGVLSGLLGIGGAVLMIPMLVYIYGFEQHLAQGTTLMLMVPPIGILAAMEYYKQGNVDLKAAAVIALFFFVGGLVGAKLANKIDSSVMKKIFAVVLILMGVRMWFK